MTRASGSRPSAGPTCSSRSSRASTRCTTLPASSSSASAGIGLGLCLVKRFVELHGGSIEFTSEPSAGSTFTFVLPRRPVAPLRVFPSPSRP
ncbi:MAG: ATP-binding protein [Isosphaeraceae bacterium]